MQKMLGKKKDVNIQLKPQQILETESLNKKKPTPIHVAEQILNLHQRQESTMYLRQCT